ncbi:TonB-dependent receptor plug domain-containing protein [Pseudoxanthomonas wuyuanensis]
MLTALASSAQAQENTADLASLSLEQLLDLEVVTASRFDQKANRAPAAVQIISAEEIRAHGWRTLGEALESLPGLYLSDSGLYTYLGARGRLHAGDYDTRFLLLVDGHRINDPVYSQSPVGSEFPLDMALVQRIEYVPGPGSAVYGSNAFFGVINVLTKPPGPSGEGELALAGESYGTRATRATLSAGGTLLSASQSHSRGRDFHFQEFAEADSAGMARGQDDERVRRLFVRHTAGDLALLVLAGDRRKEDPIAPYGQSFGIPGAGVQDRWAMLGLQYGRALSAATRWQAQLDLIDYRYIGDYAYGDSPTVINRDVSSGRSLVLGSRLVTTAFAGHIMAVGLEAQWDRAVEQLNYDVEPYASYLQSRENIANIGAFVTDEIALGGDWLLNAGLRLDHNDVGTVRLSPRLALISAPADGTTFKAIVGKAFRSPNAYERFYGIDTEDGAQLLNPDISAESIQTIELYFSRNLGSRSRAELSLFDYRLQHLITLTGEEDLLTLDNAGSASSTGAELAFVHRWEQGAMLRSSYSYSRVRESSAARPLNAPRGIGTVSATLPLAHGLSAAVSTRYMSQRATRLGTAGRHTVVNANLLWEPAVAPWSLSAGVRNLLDERYADPVGPEFTQDAIPRRGREYRIELTWQF